MTHGVPGGIERFELDGLADLDDVPGAKPAIDTRNALTGILVRQQLGAGRSDHGAVAAGMIAVLVRIQNLSDLPAVLLGRGQALLMIQRIDGQRFTRFRAGDQVVEVAIRVRGPDLFDDHGGSFGFDPGLS